MPLTRREFFARAGAGSAGALSAGVIAKRAGAALAALGLTEREIEAVLFAQDGDLPVFGSPVPGLRDSQVRFKLHGNENPRGPAKAALEAIRDRVNGDAGSKLGWYPQNWPALEATIGRRFDAAPENILLATASGPLLPAAVRAFTSPSRPLVTGRPTFESPERTARTIGTPVQAVPVGADFRLDLDAIERAATGAGLVFICNPNNPTATAHSGQRLRDLIARVKRASPSTAFLIDEAYIDFADDPDEMTVAGEALDRPGVVVTRTFSKAFGMGNLRLGHAVGQPDTLEALSAAWGLGSVSGLTAAAAIAALEDPVHLQRLREENQAIRRFTATALEAMGLETTPSQTNFLFVDVKRPVREFRAACLEHQLLVARDFPPLTNHCRLSIGTMAQMQEVVEIIGRVV